PRAGRLQDGEKGPEQHGGPEEDPGFAPKQAQQLADPRGMIVAAAYVAFLDEADDPAWQAEQDQHQHPAQEQLPDFRIVLGDVGVHRQQQEGADDWAEEGVDAAQKDHQQHLGRLGPMRQVGIHAAVVDHDQGAGQAGEGADQDEGVEPVAIDRDTDKVGPLGVFPDGGQRLAERRVDDAPQQVDRRDADDEHELVVVGEGWLDDPVGHGYADQAVVAAGEVVPLERDQVDDVAEGQRQDGEVDVRTTTTEVADDQRREGTADRRRQQPDVERQSSDVLEQQPGRVAPDAEIGGLAERDHSSIAHQQVERQREQRPDEH